MSQEQEDAAKWQMFENYKNTRAKLAALRVKVQSWRTPFTAIASAFSPGGNVDILQSQMQNIAALPSKEELQAAVQEMISLNQLLVTLKNELKNAGMDLP